MVALERRGVLIHLLVTILLIIGVGVFGYLSIRALPESKVAAERFLMVSVVIALLSVVSGYLLYRRGQNLNQTLRIAEQRLRQGGFSARHFFEERGLGTLGKELQSIYQGVEEISEKKSLRIGALNALNSFLLSRSEERLLVINVQGAIFQASDAFLASLEAKRGEVVGQDVTKLLPDLDLDKAINHFYRDRNPMELGSGDNKMRLYPVFDARRELAYCVIAFDEVEEMAMPKIPEPIQNNVKNVSQGWLVKVRERWGRGRPKK